MSLTDNRATKKCPFCHAMLKTADTKCFQCKNKVGQPDEYGIAKKPTDWWSYLIALVSCSGFVYFMYWLFFLKDKGE